MQNLNANLNQLIVGQTIAGSSTGTLKLPAHNTIDATSIIVGDGGDGTLRLGQTNAIAADELVVGRTYSTARVEVPLGATVELGSPERRTDVSIGIFDANTNASLSGEMDFTGAKLVAHLGQVIIGGKSGGGAGIGSGVLTIGSDGGNHVTAESITLGVDSGHGTLNFGGGSLTVGTIERGSGVAAFNWQGGSLSVNSFGSPASTMNLDNLGSGTLAPGASPGGTHVFGNYHQGAAATYQADLGGTVPVTNYDQVNVSAIAQVGGTLDARLYNGFTPSSSDTFTVLTAGTLNGHFANAPAGASSLLTPFGSFDVAYSSTAVTLSNFIPDPLAPAASIGALNGYADDVLGGSGITGGVDASFHDHELGILSGQHDVVNGVDLADLVSSGVLDFTMPNFALPAGQLQVWELSFDGDSLGPGGISLVFGYDDAGMTQQEESELDIFHFAGGAWVPLGGTVDTSANTISVLTHSLSPFGVGIAAVPEPSTLLLASLALVGLAVHAVRRQIPPGSGAA